MWQKARYRSGSLLLLQWEAVGIPAPSFGSRNLDSMGFMQSSWLRRPYSTGMRKKKKEKNDSKYKKPRSPKTMDEQRAFFNALGNNLGIKQVIVSLTHRATI